MTGERDSALLEQTSSSSDLHHSGWHNVYIFAVIVRYYENTPHNITLKTQTSPRRDRMSGATRNRRQITCFVGGVVGSNGSGEQ